jgi:hypothetical protein
MQEFTFKMWDDESYQLVGYRGDEETVTVPSTFHGKPVTILYDGLFKGHTEIKRVIIPEGITDIGGFVFDGCTSLEQIDLPTTLKDIWQYGFARCGIREIRLPENVERLIPFTFKDCRNLEKIYCMPGLKEVQAYAFRGCRKDIQLVTMRILKISPKAFEDR